MKFIKNRLKNILHSGMNNKKGFTLVEMLVVIAILIVLISIITPQVMAHIESANEVACSANVNTIVREYTAKAVWRYTMTDLDAKVMMMEVASGHSMAFVPYSDSGLHSGCMEKVCPSGGTYVCDFTKDLLTVTIVCDKHGSIKLDVVALYDQLSKLNFGADNGYPTGFPYKNIDAYFSASRTTINSDAIGTGTAYAPYSSFAEAISAELNRQGVNVKDRTWRIYKAGSQYSMFLAPGKISVDQDGQWITCEKYDMVKKETVTGYIKVSKESNSKGDYPVLNGASFTPQKPKDFKG